MVLVGEEEGEEVGEEEVVQGVVLLGVANRCLHLSQLNRQH